MMEHHFYEQLLEVLHERNTLLKEQNSIMATLDQDVQAATIVINDLVTALAAATGSESGVSAADQTALEAAIVSGNNALTPVSTTPVTTPVTTTPPAPIPTS